MAKANKWTFQLTTVSPQTVGQKADTSINGKTFYRARYADEDTALFMFERAKGPADIWAFQPGVSTGGYVLAERGAA
jgi:hypothetical protein